MQHQLHFTDSGKTITAHPGDELIVRLEENPTTGYRWMPEPSGNDLWELKESKYELFAASGTGGGGNRTFHFILNKEGTGTLILKNGRQWSGAVHQTFTLNVVVR